MLEVAVDYEHHNCTRCGMAWLESAAASFPTYGCCPRCSARSPQADARRFADEMERRIKDEGHDR